MCNHAQGPWVQRAVGFLQNPLNQPDGIWHTVNYLIENNHCGINNRVDIQRILNYIGEQGINVDREAFQQEILGPLKRAGIVATLVYPGPQGGVFIPRDEGDVNAVVGQVLGRIESEINNVLGISTRAEIIQALGAIAGHIGQIRQIL